MNKKLNKSITFDLDVLNAAEIIVKENNIKLSAYVNDALKTRITSSSTLSSLDTIAKRLELIEYHIKENKDILQEIKKMLGKVGYFIQKYNSNVLKVLLFFQDWAQSRKK